MKFKFCFTEKNSEKNSEKNPGPTGSEQVNPSPHQLFPTPSPLKDTPYASNN